MPDPNPAIRSFYATHGPMTDPGEHADLLSGLPTALPDLVRVVQGLLIHPLCLDLYHVELSARQRAEVQLRSVSQMLARMRSLDPTSLTVARPPAERLVGNCRDHAVLFCGFLRQQGIPARVRVGFATYLGEGMNHDHWVTEVWDEARGRWLLVDPQIDDVQREAMQVRFDTLDMRTPEHFFLAGQAWQVCRRGEARSVEFGFNNKWKGWSFIRGSVLRDLDALNRIEVLPWDSFGDLIRRSERETTAEDRELFDRLAELTVCVDERFDELRETYEHMPYSRDVHNKLQMLGLIEGFTAADPNQLRPSGIEQLAERGNVMPELATEYTPYPVPDAWLPPVPHQLQAADLLGDIVISGARQHNLKSIDVTIPRFKLVVVTGVSGSGKSSLAFDTLYAEGQRRYVESLSAYARQFLTQMEKPDVDHILGLSPTIAIEQRTVSRNPRSTVGTVTEVADYLRVLYARAGTPHCPQCGRGVVPQSARQIVDQLASLPAGTRFQVLSPVVRGRKGSHVRLLQKARRDGYARARIDGEGVDLTTDPLPALDKNKVHRIDLVVDRLAVPDEDADSDEGFGSRLTDSVETALHAAEGQMAIVLAGGEEILLSEHHACPYCEISFPELQPALFSFNSPSGMCPECNGLGTKLVIDPECIVTRPHLSLLDGASIWHGDVRNKPRWWARNLGTLAEHYGVDLELPWNELPQKFQEVVLYGSGEERIHFTWDHQGDDSRWSGESYRPTRGVVSEINRLFRQTKSEHRRRFYMQFMSNQPCPACQGERLCAEARFVTVGGARLPEVTTMTIAGAHEWVAGLPEQFTREQNEIAGEVLKELASRLQFMLNVGLHYLTLDRPAPSLSGGEGQRIRLASQLGCGLVGVTYVLDEPSIGLHPRDHRALLQTLQQLRDAGNTVVVIEHDADTMRLADWLIDLGPGAGVLGGELVAVGTPEQVMANPDSLTGRYLSGELAVTPPNGQQRRTPQGWLTLVGARLHNLKGIDVRFPLGLLTCVTGVSGSGKSSLVAQTLHPALQRALHNAKSVPGPHERIDGLDQIDKVIHITQAPIGRTPRSNPGTYVRAFTHIRQVFANTPEAKARGYRAGRFSFNAKGGQCQVCRGHGRKRVEMHFLPDVWVTCKACGGSRYNRQTLEVTYRGKTIADVLDMDVQEALDFFANHPRIARILTTLRDVGLDYVKLGQSALTLSGGEAQRVKLAKELSRRDTGRTLYILDEPTTGLHLADIQKLLDVLHRLTDAGNTVVVIEHNLDVIRTADWIVDLGPEGGQEGGHIVAEGPPERIATVEGSYTGRFLREIV